MTQVLLGVGSNIDRDQHIVIALDSLTRVFGELMLSSIYESDAIGFAGQPFYNLVVRVNTDLPMPALVKIIRKIEDDNGRNPNAKKFSSRKLDIDLLTYGETVGEFHNVVLPRDEITKNAYVLLPLAEVVPKDLHPQLGVDYASLWAKFEDSSQRLWPVDFQWRGRCISIAGQYSTDKKTG